MAAENESLRNILADLDKVTEDLDAPGSGKNKIIKDAIETVKKNSHGSCQSRRH